MSSVTLAFGPGESFYCRTPKETIHRGIPLELQPIVCTGGEAVKIFALALGGDSRYLIAYSDEDGQHHLQYSSNIQHELRTWLVGDNNRLKRNLATLKVLFNANGAGFKAYDKNGAHTSDCSNEELGVLQKSTWESANEKPLMVCLGINGASVVVLNDKMTWSLSDEYRQLDEFLDKNFSTSSSQRSNNEDGIELLAMNAYGPSGRFVVITKKGGLTHSGITGSGYSGLRRVLEDYSRDKREEARKAADAAKKKKDAEHQKQMDELDRLAKAVEDARQNLKKLNTQTDSAKSLASKTSTSSTSRYGSYSGTSGSSLTYSSPLTRSTGSRYTSSSYYSSPFSASGRYSSPYSSLYSSPYSSLYSSPYSSYSGFDYTSYYSNYMSRYLARMDAQNRQWAEYMQRMYGPNGWATQQQRHALNQIMGMYSQGGSSMYSGLGGGLGTGGGIFMNGGAGGDPTQMLNSMGTSVGMDPSQILGVFGGTNPFSMMGGFGGMGMDPTGGMGAMFGQGLMGAAGGMGTMCSVM